MTAVTMVEVRSRDCAFRWCCFCGCCCGAVVTEVDDTTAVAVVVDVVVSVASGAVRGVPGSVTLRMKKKVKNNEEKVIEKEVQCTYAPCITVTVLGVRMSDTFCCVSTKSFSLIFS